MNPLRLDLEGLRRAPTFHSLSEPDSRALLQCFRSRRVRAGDTLFQEGDPGNFLLLIGEGTLLATTRGPGGKLKTLARMGPGEVVGEMAFLDPTPRAATVTAVTDALVHELDRDSMDVLRDNVPGAARALVRAAARSVARRLRRLEERIDHELHR